MPDSHLDKLKSMLRQVDPNLKAEGLSETLERRAETVRGGGLEGIRRGAIAEADRAIAIESLDVVRQDGQVDGEQRFALEAIVMPYHRPVVDVRENRMIVDQLTNKWSHLGEEPLRSSIETVFRSIGRINVPHLPSLPYAGTGFVVGVSPNNPGHHLLMTNRHVASIFAQGRGRRAVSFKPGQGAVIDFYHENGRTQKESLEIDKVLMIHPHMDMAILEVKGLPEDRAPLPLSVADPAQLQGRDVVVVGYPGYDPTPDEEFQRIQNRIFRSVYYVKRLQPGQLRSRSSIADSEHLRKVDVVTHDSSTLGGNSGSAVLLLPKAPGEPVRVIALHFAGEYMVANYAIPAHDLAQDPRVADTGIKFPEAVEPLKAFYDDLWGRLDGEAGEVPEGGKPDASGPRLQTPGLDPAPAPIAVTVHGASITPRQAEVTIPLRITVTLGTPQLAAPLTTGAAPTKAAERLFGFEEAPAAIPQTRFSAASLAKTDFAWDKALSLALASDLSYRDGIAVNAEVRSAWRLSSATFFDRDDTQCFVTSTQGIALVAFRGTESLGDWLGNLNAITTNQSYGDVHRGFHAGFAAVRSSLETALRSLSPSAVILTGHSLGGALAVIAAAEWKDAFPIASIYTFGQPAVGRGKFPSFMNQNYGDRFFRFVNDDDIVPQVPPGYVHTGRLIHFDANGGVKPRTEALSAVSQLVGSDGPPTMSETEFDLLRARLLQQRAYERAAASPSSSPVRVEALEAPRIEGLFPSFSDHRMINYLTKIAAMVRP